MHEPETPPNEIDCSTVERTVNIHGLAKRYPVIRAVVERMGRLHAKGITLEPATYELAGILRRERGLGAREAFCVAQDAALSFTEPNASPEAPVRS